MTCEVRGLYFIGPNQYRLEEEFVYYSERYNKFLTVPVGKYDGATGFAVPDICPRAWLTHDAICQQEKPTWDDGTPITAWQAARVLSDILKKNKHHVRSITWLWGTFLLGCHASRRNGWF